MNKISYAEIIRKYPAVRQEDFREHISSVLRDNNIRIVVLDDDPTGIQTVQGNYLLTNWNAENLAVALSDEVPFFYILTNTRAMTAADAEKTVREVMNTVLDAAVHGGNKLVFISRSDSTLRGHFPLEPEVMRQEIAGREIPVLFPTVFSPAFFEAGRCTIGGIHYMKEGDTLIPVSETEFARDNVFRYTRSDLSGYIREKSGDRVRPEEIGYIPLEDLRLLTVGELENTIRQQSCKKYLALDALEYSDLQKFAAAYLQILAKTAGYSLLRTSSSLPKALTGIAEQPLLERSKLTTAGMEGGLFIVGSHVRKTTRQLSILLEMEDVKGVEIDIHQVLVHPENLLAQVEEQLLEIHLGGRTPVIYTSRRELRLDDPDHRQRVGKRISDFLVNIIQNLKFQPAYLVAKGGITSHDILTEGLGIERARVLGQALPGVPAVVTGEDHRFPGMPYIIFPGNVGSEDALKEVFERLK